MSVSFFDPENQTIYDDEYNVVREGTEVNFSNVNAAGVLRVMGLYDVTCPDLFGNMDGEVFIKLVERGIYVCESTDQLDIKFRLEKLLEAFSEAKFVHWG